MSTIFDELQATKRLIEDNRTTLYRLQESAYDNSDPQQPLIRDKQIILKGLELYLDLLEGTVNARSRAENREKSYDQINNRRNNRGGYSRPRPNSAVVDEIVVDTYNDAAAVLEELIAYLEQYGRVPISAYYDAFGVTDNRDWTNVRWGWTTLNTAKVVPVRGGGYTVDLPPPEPL